MTVLLDQVVMTDYGLLYLSWEKVDYDGDIGLHFAGQRNGWLGAALPGMLFLGLARRSGGSAIRLELLDARPDIDAPGEDCAEVSVVLSGDHTVWWNGFAGMDEGSFDLPGGTYRVRATARGRDAGADGEFEERVVDWYLLQFWRAAAAPDVVVRAESVDGRYWNAAWGSASDEVPPATQSRLSP